jgi:hypothetical protein
MVLDVLLKARDEGLYSAVTDCGAGGFSSAVGEMGAEIGAEVWLDRAPLKYEGLSYTEIWISEAQERMVWRARGQMAAEARASENVRHQCRQLRADRQARLKYRTRLDSGYFTTRRPKSNDSKYALLPRRIPVPLRLVASVLLLSRCSPQRG